MRCGVLPAPRGFAERRLARNRFAVRRDLVAAISQYPVPPAATDNGVGFAVPRPQNIRMQLTEERLIGVEPKRLL